MELLMHGESKRPYTLDMSTRVSQISTFVQKLMGSGLMWIFEEMQVQRCHFSGTDLLYAVCFGSQVLKFIWGAKT